MTPQLEAAAPLPLAYGKRPGDLDVLGRSPLLRGLSVGDLARLLDLLDQVAVPAGSCVLGDAEGDGYTYFVLEGEARLRRGQRELRIVGAGETIGELALLGTAVQPVTAYALSTMRLARLSRRRFLSLATNHPRVALHLLEALAMRLGEQLTEMTDAVGLLAHQRSIPRHTEVHVRRGTETVTVAPGALVGSLLPHDEGGALVVAALLNRRPCSLEEAVVADADVGNLTLASWEGRAVYLRSAGLLLLEAARQVAPHVALRPGSPVENGQTVLLPEGVDADTLVRSISDSLARLVASDVALRNEVWSTDEAHAHMLERGDHAAAHLLSLRRESTVTLASCGKTLTLGMGPLVPRAGYLPGLTLHARPDGLLLRASALDPHMPVHRASTLVSPAALESSVPRCAGAMARAQREWLDGLRVRCVGDFDQLCIRGGVDELIRVAEGFHEKWISRIADEIVQRKEAVQAIVIAGPSSSGKTTFIKRLVVQLLVNGLRPRALSLDDYYVDRERTVRDASGELDFEAFEALDRRLLAEHVAHLLAGQEVTTARYDFSSGRSLAHGGPTMRLSAGDVLLLEGIHGLNPSLLPDAVPPNRVFRVFVHPATTLPFDGLTALSPEDVRLLRRIVRDRHQRNYTAAQTIARWPSVRRGELCHVFPHLGRADAVFDSSLVYEMSVLKTYAERYLLEVAGHDDAFVTAHRLRCLLDQFVAIHPDHVPPTSVIREFIGGSGFQY